MWFLLFNANQSRLILDVQRPVNHEGHIMASHKLSNHKWTNWLRFFLLIQCWQWTPSELRRSYHQAISSPRSKNSIFRPHPAELPYPCTWKNTHVSIWGWLEGPAIREQLRANNHSPVHQERQHSCLSHDQETFKRRRRFSSLVRWRFKPNQPQKIILGLKEKKKKSSNN